MPAARVRPIWQPCAWTERPSRWPWTVESSASRPRDYAERQGTSRVDQCQQRHTHIEWPKFLRQLDRQTPKGKTLHLIADNHATHKHPNVQKWLAEHPHFNMHFTPTPTPTPTSASASASWLNRVDRFFRDITTERLRRGVFTSLPELVAAIDGHVAHHTTSPEPFIGTKGARDILQRVIRANQRSSSEQNGTLR